METSVLQKIQQELKAPKSQYNSFGKYKYRNAEDIQEALKPILAKYGHSTTISDNIIQVGDRIYIQALVKLLDASLNTVAETTGYAREPENRKGMDPAQVTGATSSYARKYALGGMFLLDDTKDADSMKSPEVEEKTPAKSGKADPKPKPPEMGKFKAAVAKLSEKMGPDVFDAFMHDRGVKTLEEITTRAEQETFYSALVKEVP